MPIQFLSAIKHLRFGFSAFLAPPFLFSLCLISYINFDILILFILLHFFIYPASNGYNSFFDRDKGSIGGFESPPPVNRLLPYFVQSLDIIALVLSLLLIPKVFIGLFIYILASRIYSYNRIRVKALPWLSYFMVGAFQGILVYFMICELLPQQSFNFGFAFLVFTYMIASYPITQVYQISEDLTRGDKTVASILNIWPTFILTGFLFITFQISCIFLNVHFIYLFVAFSTPVLFVFFRILYMYFVSNIVSFRDVQSISILNMLYMTLYFVYCLYSNSIIYLF
jgi:1,4-dihydroxy-2-naphthoate octaprenyltransferase